MRQLQQTIAIFSLSAHYAILIQCMFFHYQQQRVSNLSMNSAEMKNNFCSLLLLFQPFKRVLNHTNLKTCTEIS